MRRPRVFLVVLLLVLTACTKDKKPAPTPDPDAELNAARARLAALAQSTAAASYDATYTFVQEPGKATGTIRIRQSPPQYRIDIATKDGASYFALRTGVVSCSSRAKKRTCFLVARPGEEVPALFDPGVQRLFRDAVEDLAAHPDDYVVVRPTGPSGASGPSGVSGALPAGECFDVTRTSETPAPDRPGFESGTYCFAEAGVATSITVASGTLTLTKLGGAPPPSAFKPYAKVQKLPDLTPTPKATSSAK